MSHRILASVRVLVFLIALGGALWGPWWLPVLLMVLVSLRFRAYEALFLGLLMDFMWLSAGSFTSPLPLFTLGAIALVWLSEPFRRAFLV